MKKPIVYLLSTALLIMAVNFCTPETIQAAQQTEQKIGTPTTVTDRDSLTGIKKLKKEQVKAVILGDSIAVSQGSSNPSNGWNKDLKKELYKKYSNKIIWDNKAQSGSLIDYCLLRAPEITDSTDAVFICVGRNDRNFYQMDEFKEKYEQLIQLIQNQAPNADIFCIVEPPMISDEFSFMGIRTAIINAAANTETNLLDVWSCFPRDVIGLEPLLKDGLHPNNDGYSRMADYMYNSIVTTISMT